MVPFKDRALFPLKKGESGKSKTLFVLMSQDIMWEQFVSFPPYLSVLPLFSTPPQAGPETTDSITHPILPHGSITPWSLPESQCPVLSHWAGGGFETGDSFFSVAVRG